MINFKVGQYVYKLNGSQYRIYRCDFNNGVNYSFEEVIGEPFFTDPELARKRVYELNGWSYKSKETSLLQ